MCPGPAVGIQYCCHRHQFHHIPSPRGQQGCYRATAAVTHQYQFLSGGLPFDLVDCCIHGCHGVGRETRLCPVRRSATRQPAVLARSAKVGSGQVGFSQGHAQGHRVQWGWVVRWGVRIQPCEPVALDEDRQAPDFASQWGSQPDCQHEATGLDALPPPPGLLDQGLGLGGSLCGGGQRTAAHQTGQGQRWGQPGQKAHIARAESWCARYPLLSSAS